MGKRVLTAALGVPLLLFLAWMGGQWLSLAVAALAFLGAREFLALAGAMKQRLLGLVLYFGSPWLVLAAAAGAGDWLLALPAATAILLWLVFFPRRTVAELAVTLFGTYYVGLLVFLPLLRRVGWEALLLALLAVWLGDTAAFFTGRALGRHRLAAALSPAKTMEGALAGLLASALGGLVWAVWLNHPLLPSLLAASLAGAAGQVGDLLESGLKRQAGVKDAGGLLPGHGGVLDRFDSLLLAAPVVYSLWWPLIIGR